MELVEGHLVLEKLPAEFGLIVDIGNFLDWLGLGGGLCVELLWDGIGAVPQLLEERRRDSEEVHARECLDLANLDEMRGDISHNSRCGEWDCVK